MNKTFYLFIFLLVINNACKPKEKEIVIINKTKHIDIENINNGNFIDSIKLSINFKPQGNYNTIKTKLISDRSYFKKLYERIPNKAIDSASKYLYSKLLNDIVPHWYNTTWDFNGHTNIPKQGDIACGYFVSTTLKHLGFNLNRYKMAQQAGLIEAQVLQHKSQLKMYSNLPFPQLKEKINNTYTNGIYFVGLDNHVGYILIKDKELYFLHSSYYDDKVMIELAETSPCFVSNFYVFAEITTNKELVKHWILDKKLSIPSH